MGNRDIEWLGLLTESELSAARGTTEPSDTVVCDVICRLVAGYSSATVLIAGTDRRKHGRLPNLVICQSVLTRSGDDTIWCMRSVEEIF